MWTVDHVAEADRGDGFICSSGLATFALLAWGARPALVASGYAGRSLPRRPYGRLSSSVFVVLVLPDRPGRMDEIELRGTRLRHGFPKCLGQWWPQTDFPQGISAMGGIGDENYEAGVLRHGRGAVPSRLAHRIGPLSRYAISPGCSNKDGNAGLAGLASPSASS